MRILFTFVGGHGHLEPLVPIARAAREAGHAVSVACGPAMAAAVRAAGLEAIALGIDGRPLTERLPLRPVDRTREERDLRERFARRAARYRAPLVGELCDGLRPDVLVCDETDFGAMVAAEACGLPFATVCVIAAGGFVRPDVVGETLDALRAEHGLPPDPGLAMPGRYLVLASFPPRYRDPAHPLPATAHCFRPPGPATVTPPPWTVTRPGAPAVYFTLGTVFNMESGALLEHAVAALGALPVNLLVTVGHAIDPAALGPQPPHVHVARHIPQAEVLPHCDGVVSHGGSGSVIGAIAHGLPLVVLPLGADQPWNADRCVALGLGEALDAVRATAADLRGAVTRVLGEPRYRRSAARLRAELEALPDVSAAVALLERLASERRPVTPR